jgi:hypothetical protein
MICRLRVQFSLENNVMQSSIFLSMFRRTRLPSFSGREERKKQEATEKEEQFETAHFFVIAVSTSSLAINIYSRLSIIRAWFNRFAAVCMCVFQCIRK